jgi:hypothetical protein
MLFALVVVMAGILLLTMVVNNRRPPSRWERRNTADVSPGGHAGWGYGGDAGPDCSVDAGGGDCGGGDGGGGGD